MPPKPDGRKKDSKKKRTCDNISQAAQADGASGTSGGDGTVTSESPYGQCKTCKVRLYNIISKGIQCERCSEWYCIACACLSDEDYEYFGRKRACAHWYCFDCEEAAVKAVTSDQLIE